MLKALLLIVARSFVVWLARGFGRLMSKREPARPWERKQQTISDLYDIDTTKL